VNAFMLAMDDVERGVDFVITRQGEPVAVLISAERYDELTTALNDLNGAGATSGEAQ
jgi:prevent-host-death family protein